jgi:SAM-dependent methyltransferase
MNLFIKIFGEKNVSFFYGVLTSKLRSLSSYVHRKQMQFDWSRSNEPRWFNHFQDQFFQLRTNKSTGWIEIGVFNSMVIAENSSLLELGCGDGFNTFHFYSSRCKDILAVDFDTTALKFAEKYNHNSKIKYVNCNILNGLPVGQFNNIIWDGSIEQFNENEINIILTDIKQHLLDRGVLSGHTVQGNRLKSINLSHNKREFESKEDLTALLSKFFKYVKVIKSNSDHRVTLYFFASDEILPLDL